jgi:transcriptional regulator with XRE-family HTH domain
MKLNVAKIKEKMEQMGITYSELADKGGLPRQSLSSWINGHRDPMPFNVQKIAQVLHCDISEIAEAQDTIELSTVYGDHAAMEINGKRVDFDGNAYSVEQELIPGVVSAIAKTVSNELRHDSQSELARRLGLSSTQISRIARGEADLTLMPLSALLRLCPQIIDKGILSGKPESKLVSFCRNLSAEDQEKALAILQAVFANK